MKINMNLLLALAFISLAGAGWAQDSPTVKVAGLRVISEAAGSAQNRLVPFNSFHVGTALALLLESPAAVIKFDDAESEIESFTDGEGTDLLVKPKGSFQSVGFGAFPKISEDGRAVLIEISGGGVPAKGAAAIVAKGTLSLQTASEKKLVRSEPFEPVKGTAVKVGEIELKLTGAGKPSFGDAVLELEFETTDKAFTMLAGVEFLDAGGKQLESDTAGSSRMGFGNHFTYGRSFTLAEEVSGKIVLQFEVWTDLKEQRVPFSISAGVGG